MMTHRIIQGPYIFPKKQDRIFSALDRIFSADDRIFQAQDRIFSARTVYFRPKTVYSPPGPYISPRPYIFKDRIFSFSGRCILLSHPQISEDEISLTLRNIYSFRLGSAICTQPVKLNRLPGIQKSSFRPGESPRSSFFNHLAFEKRKAASRIRTLAEALNDNHYAIKLLFISK